MKLKKVISLTAVCALVLSLAACGSKGGDTKGGKSDFPDGKQIELVSCMRGIWRQFLMHLM